MRTLNAAAGAVVLLAGASLARPATAQIPTTVGPKFEIAEARALAEVPDRADTAFLSSMPAVEFAGDTRAVVAKFQASSLPDDHFAIAWMLCGGRTPLQLAVERVDAADLSSGAYAMLTNGGAPLAPGVYQVAVLGGGGKIYRAVPFRIRMPLSTAIPPPADTPAEPDVPAEFAAYAFEGVALTYPASYAVDAIAAGHARGAIFSRPTPFASLFVLVRRTGRFDLSRDASSLLTLLARHVATDGFGAYQKGVVDYDARDLEGVEIAGSPAPGKAYLTRLGSGLTLDVTIYETELHGKSAILGYVTLADTSGAQPAPTGPDRAADDFYRMLLTIKPGDSVEPPRLPVRKRTSGLDVAVVRR